MAEYSFSTESPPDILGLRNSFEVSRIDYIGTSGSGSGSAGSSGSSLTEGQDSITVGKIFTNNVWNQFDEHGLVVSLSRNKGETNWSYRRRLYDALTNVANSTYRGLVNGITRELGLALFQPLVINPRRSPITNKFYAPDPYIRFDGVSLYLYSDYTNDILDHEIDRFEPGGNYECLKWLVDFINTTTYFEAGLISTSYNLYKSMIILNQSSRIEFEEPVDMSTKFKLTHDRLIPGSVNFVDGKSAYRVEVAREEFVNSAGKYYINYPAGIITSYDSPPLEATIRYQYTPYPFQPIASEVILHDINSDNFKVKMFNQILQDDGTYIHGTPTEIGVDTINEILSVVPMYWGI